MGGGNRAFRLPRVFSVEAVALFLVRATLLVRIETRASVQGYKAQRMGPNLNSVANEGEGRGQAIGSNRADTKGWTYDK